MSHSNSIGAILFEQATPNFINPSRVSPVRLSRQPSPGSAGTQRLHVDNRIAVCVSALFCAESKIVTPTKIGGKSERMRKWLSGIFHNQEWERFQSLMCLVFGEHLLRAQISPKKALSFQTMISPVDATTDKGTPIFTPSYHPRGTLLNISLDADTMLSHGVPAAMFGASGSSPSKGASSPSKNYSFKNKSLLAYNEYGLFTIPIFLSYLDHWLFQFLSTTPARRSSTTRMTCLDWIRFYLNFTEKFRWVRSSSSDTLAPVTWLLSEVLLSALCIWVVIFFGRLFVERPLLKISLLLYVSSLPC